MFSFCSRSRKRRSLRLHGAAHLRTQQGPGGRRCCSRCRSEAQVRARLLARIDAGRDQDVERLRLLQRIDRVVADPHKLEPGLVHVLLDHVVEGVLHPRLERHEPFLRRLLAHGLAGGATDLADERRNGDREGVADDARQPLVVLVLERRLSRFDQRGAGASALAGLIGNTGRSDHCTPFSAKIFSIASMKAGFSVRLICPTGGK
jgi:hypothetical protein